MAFFKEWLKYMAHPCAFAFYLVLGFTVGPDLAKGVFSAFGSDFSVGLLSVLNIHAFLIVMYFIGISERKKPVKRSTTVIIITGLFVVSILGAVGCFYSFAALAIVFILGPFFHLILFIQSAFRCFRSPNEHIFFGITSALLLGVNPLAAGLVQFYILPTG